MRRIVLGLGAILLSTTAFAHAASLNDATRGLASNGTTVSRCDTDSLTVVQNLSGANVVSITVGLIASACAGGTMSVAFNNGTTSSSGTGTVPGGGGSLTVTLGAAVAAKDVDQVFITIAGP